MKLVTKLKIFGVFATCMMIFLGITIYWRFSQVDSLLKKNKIAGEIVKQAFTLEVLSGDYIQNGGQRAEIQWRSQYRNLNDNISSYIAASPDEIQTLHKLRRGQETILAHFHQLQVNVQQRESTSSATPVLAEAAARLTSQLALDMQEVVSLASALEQINTNRLSQIRQTTGAFLLFVIVLLSVSLITTYYLFARSISKSMTKLTKGTKVLAGGNLDFRVDIKTQDEFGQLAHSFNDMAAQLQELDQTKDEFIMITSHELRTPMTAIRGFLSMMLKGDYGTINDHLKKPLKSISVAAEHELGLINQLLDVSRLQTGKTTYTITDFPIGPVTKTALTSLQPLADPKGITLTLMDEDPTPVRADIHWVIRILTNLIDNAIKFTQTGGVSVSHRIEANRVCVVITDTGIGITPVDQKKLFKKFRQISSKYYGKPPGSGLGLYLSHAAARNMGGDVWLEQSAPGKGSTFVVAIPRAI